MTTIIGIAMKRREELLIYGANVASMLYILKESMYAERTKKMKLKQVKGKKKLL